MAKRIKVLVVEDEAVLAMNVKMALMAEGYEVLPIAISGDAALAIAAQYSPDVALMDIRIKGDKDGIEVARLLYSHFKTPVIYTTAYFDDETVARAKSSPHAGYLIKPYTNNELFRCIEKAYNGKHSGG